MSKQDPDKDAIQALLEEYTENFTIHSPTDVITVQFHDHPEEMNEIVGDLIDRGYSLKVDQAFEVPPQLTVRERVIEPQ